MVVMNIKKKIEQVKELGFTSVETHTNELFKAKEFKLCALDIMEGCATTDGEVLITGLCNLDSCMAFTVEAACEAFGRSIIHNMKGFEKVSEKSKVYISDAITIEGVKGAKMIVASVRDTSGNKIVEEYLVATKEYVDEVYEGKEIEELESGTSEE